MATLSQQVQQQVLSDPRARDYNVPDSDRTYYEMLSDPNVGDLIKDDVSKSFIKIFIQPPPIKEQELRGRRGRTYKLPPLLGSHSKSVHYP